MRWLLGALVVALLLAAPSAAFAERCVGIFFRGFAAPVGTSGMDNLEAYLFAAYGGNPARPFSTAVFDYTEASSAFAFLDGFSDVDCVILAGHSFGGNTAIEFTTDFLEPAGIPVDALVQFDSVGANDGVLPASVVQGFNYSQISTSFFEPQGESTVLGSTNVQVEAEYGVSNSDITHTQIDCPLFERSESQYAALFGAQPDLYERIEADVAPLFAVAAVPALPSSGVAILVLASITIALVGLRETSRSGTR